MTIEQYWTGRLRTFSLLDYSLVKLVYLLFGLWALQLYPPLAALDWWFGLALFTAATLPLFIHWLAADGGVLDRSRQFIAGNTPAFQVLLFFAQFFIGITLGLVFPVLTSGPWWLLLLLIVLTAIKPMTKTLLW